MSALSGQDPAAHASSRRRGRSRSYTEKHHCVARMARLLDNLRMRVMTTAILERKGGIGPEGKEEMLATVCFLRVGAPRQSTSAYGNRGAEEVRPPPLAATDVEGRSGMPAPRAAVRLFRTQSIPLIGFPFPNKIDVALVSKQPEGREMPMASSISDWRQRSHQPRLGLPHTYYFPCRRHVPFAPNSARLIMKASPPISAGHCTCILSRFISSPSSTLSNATEATSTAGHRFTTDPASFPSRRLILRSRSSSPSSLGTPT